MHGWIYMTLNVFQIMLHFIETFGLGDIAYDIWPVLISFIMKTFSSFYHTYIWMVYVKQH